MSCINEKKCHENCTKCEDFMKTEDALDKTIERIYDSNTYTCGAYMCTVATTYYGEEETKRICCRCLKDRFLKGEC